MTTESEVRQFLNEFHQKLQVFEILFWDERGKNQKALAQLEITRIKRRQLIEQLEKQDYCEGPLEDKLYGMTSLWVFGKKVNQMEVYIKISKGWSGSQVICISFHVAEKPMIYPFKPTTK